MENAPYFAKEFVKKVEREFKNNHSIAYTNIPDMRIRRSTDNARNAVTITWQPRNERFMIGTDLNPGDVKFTDETYERIDPLSLLFYLDETTINRNVSEILKCLKHAHEKHAHEVHR